MNITTILLCIFIIFIVIYLIIYYDIQQIPEIPQIPLIENSQNKYCILLTMYIKNKEQLYYNIVNRWLNETSLDIYIVDSSNTGLQIIHPRLYQYKFEQGDKFVTSNPSKYEINSISKIINHFNFKKYDMIIKITGKYFIPNFESYIKTIDSADLILQNRTDTHGQNTELLSIKLDLIHGFINQYTGSYNNFENYVYCKQHNYNTYRFKPLILDEYTKRSDGSILKYL